MSSQPSNLYLQLVPSFTKYAHTMSHLLDYGVKLAQEKGMTEEEMLSLTLVEDFKPLRHRVRVYCDTVKFTLQRLGGLDEVPFHADDEKTVDDLKARINNTLELLAKIEPSSMQGRETQSLVMEKPKEGLSFPFENGQIYVSTYAIPWAFFQVTAVYSILRMKGADLSALDYLRDVFPSFSKEELNNR